LQINALLAAPIIQQDYNSKKKPYNTSPNGKKKMEGVKLFIFLFLISLYEDRGEKEKKGYSNF